MFIVAFSAIETSFNELSTNWGDLLLISNKLTFIKYEVDLRGVPRSVAITSTS